MNERFLPRRLLGALHPLAAGGSGCVRFEGVAAVIDISGFTGLSERLAERGEAGVADLGRVVQRTFSRWIERIEASGGEIVRFAGDALIVCWPDRPEGPVATLAGARAAAEALADHSEEGIFLHAGLAHGPLELHRLGGRNDRWEYLLAGEALRRASHAQSRAGPREVRVAPLDPPGELRQLLEAPGPPPTSWMQGFLPEPFLARLSQGDSPWLVQLRQVYPLFFEVRDVPSDHASMQAVFELVQDVLHSLSPPTERAFWHEGHLVVRIVFGTQDNAQLDDPFRAVDAALAVVRRLGRAGWHVGAGVGGGLAFSGPVGGPSRQEHLTLGSPMNLAARLMREAHGEALVTDAVVAATQRRVHYRLAERIEVRGLEDRPTVSAAVERIRPSVARRAVFGRQVELARLDDLAADARVGEGCRLAIIGEPGIGKSALLGAALGRVAQEGVAVALGAADVLDQSASYHAVREALRSLVATGPAAPERREHLRERLGERLGLLSGLLPEVAEPTPWSRQIEGPGRADALRALLVEIIELLSEREPLFLAIDDAHWLDSASIALLEELRTRPRIALVLTSRPLTRTPARLQGLLDEIPRIELAPLDAVAIAGVLEATLGAAPSDRLVRFVETSAAGHPLYTQELAFLLERVKRLERGAGRVDLRSGYPFELPSGLETLDGLITSRIDRLDGLAERVLKTASVFGPRVPVEGLGRVLTDAGGHIAIRGALDRLVAEHLLERLPPLPGQRDPQYGFRHALTRDVSYRLLLPEQREAMHRAVGDWHESNLARVASDWSALAHHFHHAGDDRRSCRYATLAGEAALDAGAYREAVELLERSIALTPLHQRAEHIKLHNGLAEAHRGLGDIAARKAAAERSLELVGRTVPDRPIRVVKACLQALLPMPFARLTSDAEQAARALRHAAGAYYFQSRSAATFQAALAAYRFASRAEPGATLSGAAVELGGALGLLGLDGPARRLMSQGVEVARRISDPTALGYAYFVSGLYGVGRGDLSAATEAVEACQPHFLQLGDRLRWGDAQVVRFWAAFYRGELDEAEAAAAALLGHARESGNRQHEAWALRAQGVERFSRDRPEEAASALSASVELEARGQDRAEQLTTLGYLAAARLRLGEREAAEAALRAGLERARAVKRPTVHIMHLGFARLLEATLELYGPQRRELRSVRRRLSRAARVFPVGGPLRDRVEGDLAAARGEERRARHLWRRGLARARALGMGLEIEALEARLFA